MDAEIFWRGLQAEILFKKSVKFVDLFYTEGLLSWFSKMIFYFTWFRLLLVEDDVAATSAGLN